MTTAFFFSLPAHGHVNPSLPVVQELTRRGERVVYYATPEFQAKIAAVGAEFRAYETPQSLHPDPIHLGPVGVMAALFEATEHLLPTLLAHIAADKPDYLVVDAMAVWGNLLQQITQRPTVCSCPIFVVHPRAVGVPPLDGAGLRLLLRTWPAWVRHARVARRLDRRYGTRSPGFPDFFINQQALNIVYTSRAVQPRAEVLDATYHFVGPALGPRAESVTFPWAQLPAARPVVFASLGTLFNNSLAFFQACVAAFQDSPWAVVLALGHRVPPNALGALPPHIVAQPYVPQLEVLARTAIFITHGGMNSVNEALWHGIPLVVVPQAGDQYFVARRIAELRAGVWLPAARVSPATLQAAVAQVAQNPEFKANAEKLGASLRASGGPPRAADEILAFAQRTQA